ncbi:MAG TPA: hypothetical protein VK601_19045 [Kofleriaceae bacterium]|nr:hypothetical protein [Kofleriaceae bacterium]
MNRRLAALAAALLFVTVTREAVAGKKEVIEVHVDGTGAPDGDPTKACVRRADGTIAGNDDQISLAVVGGTLKVDLHVAIGKVPINWVAKKPVPPIPNGAYANEEVLITKKVGATAVCTLKPLANEDRKDTVKDATDPASVQTSTLTTAKFTEDALAALTGQFKVAGHHTPTGSDDYFGGTYTIYHLPDGSAAFPIPQHISEKDTIELAIVLPVGATAKIDILACDEVPTVRVDGSLKAATAAAGQIQSGETEFVLKSYPVKLSCAGTLSYRIQTSGGGAAGNTTSSIPIDPVYRFHWGAGAMFDFGMPHVVGLKDRPAASGMGTEKFVTDSADRGGLKPLVTLSASVCKTNPKNFNACDVFVPTVWLDPRRPTSGFGWGVGIRPGNYVTFLVGMTVFETQSVERGVVAPVGSTWTAPGDLPTHSDYTKQSIGFALGLSLDTGVFAKVFSKD